MADLGHAVLSAPVAVTAHPAPFTPSAVDAVDESVLQASAARRSTACAGSSPRARGAEFRGGGRGWSPEYAEDVR